MEFACLAFRIYLMLTIVNGIQIPSGIFFQAIGKSTKSAILSLSRQIVILIPSMIILSHAFGIMGVLSAGPVADGIAFILTAGSDTIGIRMPANDIALNLINYAGVPIATPSANISGKPSGTNLNDIIKDFDGNVDYFIDDGPSKIGLASTIVKVVDRVPHILRQGSISIDEINSVIN